MTKRKPVCLSDFGADYQRVSTPTYTRPVFEPKQLRFIVRAVRRYLKDHPKIKAVAGCGNSGVPLCGAVAFSTELGLITVRKASEREHQDHGGQMVTGYCGPGEYLILEDCISTGNTIRHIVRSIRKAVPSLKCHGALLYRTCGSDMPDDLGNTLKVEHIPGAA